MFAYCENNPVNRQDTTGCLSGVLRGIGRGIIKSAGESLVLAAADGPLPFGDVAAVANFVLDLTLLARVERTYPTDSAAFRAATKALEKDKVKSKEEEKEKKPAVFPLNPYDFHPRGLIPIPLPGTKNGPLILWVNSFGKPIFRWDSNVTKSNGPHYHIYKLDDGSSEDKIHHRYAGDLVDEPFGTIYFGGK